MGLLFGASRYYENSFSSLNNKIMDKEEELIAIKEQRDSLELELNKISKLLDIQMRREENLSEQYTEIRTVKEKVTEEKQNLSLNLNETSALLDEANLLIDSLQHNLTIVLEELNETEAKYYNVLDDLEDVCDEAEELNISDCEDYS